MNGKDLVVLVADRNMQVGFGELLRRHRSLGTHSFQFDIFVHSGRDPGVYRGCEEFLRPFLNLYSKALVVFDHHGSGGEREDALALEQETEARLARNGWSGRCAVIVLEPELEAWVWADSPHVAREIGIDPTEWRDCVLTQGKPDRPKAALERLLAKKMIQRSSVLYGNIARATSLRQCRDRAFRKLKRTLHEWFPAANH